MLELLEQQLQEISEALYERMDVLLPEYNGRGEERLIEAMRYSALGPGKRLRPFLTVTTANIFGVSRSSAVQAAAAIEFIHTYSLIHDDLPAMDNDDFRRGEPSSHKKFDEATAILAGDALLTLAFEVLADKGTHSSNTIRCQLISAVAKAAGPMGMVGGQMMDLLAEERELSINEITHLQRLKTGELFAVSCEAGAILGNGSEKLRHAMRCYAHDLGLIFQITDDILDTEADGNDDRTDKTEGKATYISIMGVDKAREQAKILGEQCTRHLKVFGKKADLLKELAHYVVNREQ